VRCTPFYSRVRDHKRNPLTAIVLWRTNFWRVLNVAHENMSIRSAEQVPVSATDPAFEFGGSVDEYELKSDLLSINRLTGVNLEL
jgi:hypothetical protein